MRPTFIRVDADEVTYGMHIILRFELEQELIAGTLSTADLPEAWNARFEEYLGLTVPDDRLGVLQDVHWSSGALRLLPDLPARERDVGADLGGGTAALPGIDESFERGEFGEFGAWLQEHLYALGRKLTPKETLERVVGGPLDAGPYLAYLRTKYAAGIAA